MASREFEFPLTSSFFTIPHGVEGRLTSDDFINFIIDSKINPSLYLVIVESYNGVYKNIGELKSKVRLPHIHFAKEAFIQLIPKQVNSDLPVFLGTLIRGKTYHISCSLPQKSGFILMA